MDGNYRRYTFTIVGSYELMNSIRNILLNLNINIGFRKAKSIYEIYIRGNRQIIILLEWLYDATVYMNRKFKKYKDMIEWDLNKKNINKLNKEALKREK